MFSMDHFLPVFTVTYAVPSLLIRIMYGCILPYWNVETPSTTVTVLGWFVGSLLSCLVYFRFRAINQAEIRNDARNDAMFAYTTTLLYVLAAHRTLATNRLGIMLIPAGDCQTFSDDLI